MRIVVFVTSHIICCIGLFIRKVLKKSTDDYVTHESCRFPLIFICISDIDFLMSLLTMSQARNKEEN